MLLLCFDRHTQLFLYNHNFTKFQVDYLSLDNFFKNYYINVT